MDQVNLHGTADPHVADGAAHVCAVEKLLFAFVTAHVEQTIFGVVPPEEVNGDDAVTAVIPLPEQPAHERLPPENESGEATDALTKAEPLKYSSAPVVYPVAPVPPLGTLKAVPSVRPPKTVSPLLNLYATLPPKTAWPMVVGIICEA